MIIETELIDKISPAFVKAQMECESAKKSNENGAFKNNGKSAKYAGLPEVVEACFPACHANNIAVLQSLGETIDGKMGITTRLLHQSGQWIEAYGSIPLPKHDPQGYGSASTYARRYHLAAMMGIIQQDDDGNDATPSAPKAPTVKCITKDQEHQLEDLIDACGEGDEKFLWHYKASSLAELPISKFDNALKELNRKLAKLSDVT